MSHGADNEAVMFRSRYADGLDAWGSCHCAPDETEKLASAKRTIRELN
eukprot:CAMPEP_0182593270 /NCGR_PEP_ID=MMETSP1324-20130603/77682_1 /TAXON_ID=236786 /ORGANISM="Florenciella sp., Strain RCC1587" /LENGTH=47 /DNA_ID= /DNA_START= /DNA_END= /DNA_ORIENTATION=